MIISHKHKFIFIHCRKVAGSSMKVALAPFLGDNDIVIGSLNEVLENGLPMNEATKKTLKTFKGNFYYWIAKLVGKTYPESVNFGVKQFYKNKRFKMPQHPKAKEIKAVFPQPWANYKKFCFVRNPYEQVVSEYFWRRNKLNITFTEYLQLLKNKNRVFSDSSYYIKNWEMYTINNEVIVDKIGRFENLNEDFADISEYLGLGRIELNVMQKKGSHQKQYAQMYGRKEYNLVSEIFKEEIEAFRYRFPY